MTLPLAASTLMMGHTKAQDGSCSVCHGTKDFCWVEHLVLVVMCVTDMDEGQYTDNDPCRFMGIKDLVTNRQSLVHEARDTTDLLLDMQDHVRIFGHDVLVMSAGGDDPNSPQGGRMARCTTHSYSEQVDRSCGARICQDCGDHKGLERCFCGWSRSGGDGYRELIEMGEQIEED